MKNRLYLTIDAETGFIVCRHSVPAERFPPADAPPGRKIVAAEDDQPLPPGPHRFDLRKLRKAVTVVPSFAAALSSWRPPERSARGRLDIARMDALEALDREYAMHIASLRGPLASLHDEKRRQAEAGGGPLVADEADRIAVLANAQKQDEQIALIEKQRRAIKAQLRAATTEDEIKAALAAREGFA